MYQTLNNLPQADRVQLVDLLNQELADLSDLGSQTLQAHWNVRGRHFYQQHKLFEKLYRSLAEHIDDLAERISMLGGQARGTLRQLARGTRLEDFPTVQGTDLGYVEVLS